MSSIRKWMYFYSLALGIASALMVLLGCAFAEQPLIAVWIVVCLMLVAGVAGILYDRQMTKEMIRVFGEEKFYAMEAFATYWVMGLLLAMTFFLVVALLILR